MNLSHILLVAVRSHVRALDGTGFASTSGGRGTIIRPLVPTPHQPVSFCEAKDIFFPGIKCVKQSCDNK